MPVSCKHKSIKKSARKTIKRSSKNKTMRKSTNVMRGSGTVKGLIPWAMARLKKNSNTTLNNSKNRMTPEEQNNANALEAEKLRAKSFNIPYTLNEAQIKLDDERLIAELTEKTAERIAKIKADRIAQAIDPIAEAEIIEKENAEAERIAKKRADAERIAKERAAVIRRQKRATKKEESERIAKENAARMAESENRIRGKKENRLLQQQLAKNQRNANNKAFQELKIKTEIEAEQKERAILEAKHKFAYEQEQERRAQRRINNERQSAYESGQRGQFVNISRNNINTARNSEMPVRNEPSVPLHKKRQRYFLGVNPDFNNNSTNYY